MMVCLRSTCGLLLITTNITTNETQMQEWLDDIAYQEQVKPRESFGTANQLQDFFSLRIACPGIIPNKKQELQSHLHAEDQ
jgi:hypothetical protein